MAKKRSPVKIVLLVVVGLFVFFLVLGLILDAAGYGKKAGSSTTTTTAIAVTTSRASSTTAVAHTTTTHPPKTTTTTRAATTTTTTAATTTTTLPSTTTTAGALGGSGPDGCYLDPEGNCYRAGEYCPDRLHNQTVVGEGGGDLLCTDENGWRWVHS